MRATLLVCGTMLMLIFTGCSKSPEEASIDTLDEIIDVLDGIKTKEDAQKVKGKLGDLFRELEDYGKALKAPELLKSDADKRLVKKTFELLGTMGRLNPEAAEVLKDEFKEFGR